MAGRNQNPSQPQAPTLNNRHPARPGKQHIRIPMLGRQNMGIVFSTSFSFASSRYPLTTIVGASDCRRPPPGPVQPNNNNPRLHLQTKIVERMNRALRIPKRTYSPRCPSAAQGGPTEAEEQQQAEACVSQVCRAPDTPNPTTKPPRPLPSSRVSSGLGHRTEEWRRQRGRGLGWFGIHLRLSLIHI